jgi:hypothetical protein
MSGYPGRRMWAHTQLPSVPGIDASAQAELERAYVARRQPVVVRGAAKGWPAVERWSPDDFRARHGELEVDAYVMRDGHIELDPKTGFRMDRMRMREYVDRIRNDERVTRYLRADMRRLPTLAPDVPTPSVCAGRLGLESHLWFSAAGTVSQLHFDLPYNLVVMVHGRKRFTLFPVSDSANLYRRSVFSATPHLSRVDPEQPDFDRWPRLRSARGSVAELEPGDMLFIPPRVWHHARSLEHAISVNFWWRGPLLLALSTASNLYKRLRGLDI